MFKSQIMPLVVETVNGDNQAVWNMGLKLDMPLVVDNFACYPLDHELCQFMDVAAFPPHEASPPSGFFETLGPLSMYRLPLTRVSRRFPFREVTKLSRTSESRIPHCAFLVDGSW